MRVVTWTVRGMGTAEKRRYIKDLLIGAKCDVDFLQESKVMQPSDLFLRSLGGSQIDEWCYLDADG